jgi:hypothetical protein
LMAWCEASGVDFLFGLAKNKRLRRYLGFLPTMPIPAAAAVPRIGAHAVWSSKLRLRTRRTVVPNKGCRLTKAGLCRRQRAGAERMVGNLRRLVLC